MRKSAIHEQTPVLPNLFPVLALRILSAEAILKPAKATAAFPSQAKVSMNALPILIVTDTPFARTTLA